jgi:hypothetical protein
MQILVLKDTEILLKVKVLTKNREAAQSAASLFLVCSKDIKCF